MDPDPDSLDLDLDSDIDDPGPSTRHPGEMKVPKLTLKRRWETVASGPADDKEMEARLSPLVQSDDESDDDEGEETGDAEGEETGDAEWEDLAQPTIGDILGEQYAG